MKPGKRPSWTRPIAAWMSSGFTLFWFWFLLRMFGRSERFVQTMSALFGVSCLLAPFSVPLAAWLRGPLRDWAEDLLDENKLKSDELFSASAVRTAFDEHLSGRRDRHNDLWPVLMVQQWMRS